MTQRGNNDNPGQLSPRFGNEIGADTVLASNSLQSEARNLMGSRGSASNTRRMPGEVSFDELYSATTTTSSPQAESSAGSEDPFKSALAKMIERNARRAKSESTHRERDDSPNDRIKPKPDGSTSPVNLNDAVKSKLAQSHLTEESASKMNEMAKDALAILNNFREKNGLQRLKVLPALQIAAALHAAYQADAGKVTHNERSQDFSTPRARMEQLGLSQGWAENAGAGQFRDAKQLAQMWINSPPHRAALLRPELKYVGLGLEQKFDPKTGQRDGSFMGATLDMWTPPRRNV